jgi:hypothetical protein
LPSPSSIRSHSCSKQGEPHGPERFFYDKSTFTGVHAHGGHTTTDKIGWNMTMRPSHNCGSTFTRTAGHPLTQDGAKHVLM